MGFSDTQQKALSAKLNGKHVKTRDQSGRPLSYVEGWHVIGEANRIFGPDGWDRETVDCQMVWQGKGSGGCNCAYVARVRVRVRAGETVVVREGSGFGFGLGPTPGEAHENAVKEAETDAMKRALVTFGNTFGLALYDRTWTGVRGSPQPLPTMVAVEWRLRSTEGARLGTYGDPAAWCSAFKRALNAATDTEGAASLWRKNLETLARLREMVPNLKTGKDEHYVDVLRGLYEARIQALAANAAAPTTTPTRQAAEQSESPTEASSVGQAEPEPAIAGDGGPGVAGQEPGIPAASPTSPQPPQLQTVRALLPVHVERPRRLRNPAHLRHVAAQPCLICGRQPSHAHHLRFAQPRAMSKKVSDEYTVPLCAIHHDAVHRVGSEPGWWLAAGIDPIMEADRLWRNGGERDSAAGDLGQIVTGEPEVHRATDERAPDASSTPNGNGTARA